MDKFEISILKYLGKLETGILALINISFLEEDFNFDATFFYTDEHVLLTVPEEVDLLFEDFSKLPIYPKILEECYKKVVPYKELFENIDPLDVAPYIKVVNENTK